MRERLTERLKGITLFFTRNIFQRVLLPWTNPCCNLLLRPQRNDHQPVLLNWWSAFQHMTWGRHIWTIATPQIRSPWIHFYWSDWVSHLKPETRVMEQCALNFIAMISLHLKKCYQNYRSRKKNQGLLRTSNLPALPSPYKNVQLFMPPC